MNLPQGEQMGFIAQDMEKVFPQLVKTIVDKEEDNEKVVEYQLRWSHSTMISLPQCCLTIA